MEETKINKYLTGKKDVDHKIMMLLDDETLLKTCRIDKYASKLCNDETFWYNRFISKFGTEASKYKPAYRTWKKHYLVVISDLDKFSPDPWKFFNLIYWDFESPIMIKIVDHAYPIKEVSESLQNTYWLLNLGNKITLTFGDTINTNKRKYVSSTYFTPAKILELIRDYYQEPLTLDELAREGMGGNPISLNFTLEEAEKGNVKRIDMLPDRRFAGIEKMIDGSYLVMYDQIDEIPFFEHQRRELLDWDL